MKEKIYITGHKNPDTDSICAVLSYAELKNKTGIYEAIPIRLGDVNRETKFVLDYFGVEPPIYMDTMQPTVADLKIDPPAIISKNFSMYRAMEILRRHSNNTSLCIVDENEELVGIASLSNITNSYMEVWDDMILGRAGTTLDNLMEVLSGNLIYQSEEPKPMTGRMVVYAMGPENIGDKIQKNDIVVVGNRRDAQIDSIEREVSIIILTSGTTLDEDVLNMAKEHNVSVLSTEYSTFMTARLLPQAIPVSHIMTKDNLMVFHLNHSIEDIKTVMAQTRYRSYPVTDEGGHVVGSISRYHLITNEKKKLILVDHNERNQSIPDIEAAEIMEIIDHHRIANITTETPVYFRNEPVGSSCTIIAKMFFEKGVMPSKKTAGLMCAAIISDTLLFKSPTATHTDKLVLNRLAKIADIDPEEFANKMFKAGTSLENRKPIEILNTDIKKFEILGENVRISQIFTMDLENLENVKPDLLETMNDMLSHNKDDIFMAVLTDIFQEESEILIVGKYKEEISTEFKGVLENNSFRAADVLSRKKQVIPTVTNALKKKKQPSIS